MKITNQSKHNRILLFLIIYLFFLSNDLACLLKAKSLLKKKGKKAVSEQEVHTFSGMFENVLQNGPE